jgi:hypothetical protein
MVHIRSISQSKGRMPIKAAGPIIYDDPPWFDAKRSIELIGDWLSDKFNCDD